jgi:hypothetical protein
MNRTLLIVLAVFLSGFLVCLVITVPLIAWALREDNRENGIIPAKTTAKDIGAILVVAIALSLAWVLMLPLYGLMLLEKIAGKDGKGV